MRQMLLALALLTTAPVTAAPLDPAALRDAARDDRIAWDVVSGLTTEIGPRLAGTEQEARAREWAVTKLKALGFANVHVEPFAMPVWVRGEERAEVVGPSAQRLVLTALGGSGATAAAGLTASVVRVDGLAGLREASAASLKGQSSSSTMR